ncbi:LytR/AlgR family response regulator transcription factor [Flagellimonas nanhaiensis]|uniref:DNA-binding response regulator n=1 Tax=Flagellimonas nanhaiensis TaxID=2292706 RepID=A0A371JS24_9FLAO|nr:LytTR family DNA-binding domain-containing protein [Allomuricauda nanhaiensis]RDY60613.1 DNA-binding response regulator [Allomuricauda nanhaiensis]
MNDPINVIVIDDEFRAVELLKDYCKRTSFINFCEGFTNPVEAIDYINTNSIDLVFTDINMSELSGISVAKMFDNMKFVFTTAYSEFAVEGFDMDVVDYLLKPIEYERFLKACVKAKKKIQQGNVVKEQVELINSPSSIKIKSENAIYLIPTQDILYLEKLGNNMLFMTKEQQISSRINMKDAFTYLDPTKFCRVHQSFIVSLEKIVKVEHNHIHIDKYKIPIGRRYKKDFFERI